MGADEAASPRAGGSGCKIRGASAGGSCGLSFSSTLCSIANASSDSCGACVGAGGDGTGELSFDGSCVDALGSAGFGSVIRLAATDVAGAVSTAGASRCRSVTSGRGNTPSGLAPGRYATTATSSKAISGKSSRSAFLVRAAEARGAIDADAVAKALAFAGSGTGSSFTVAGALGTVVCGLLAKVRAGTLAGLSKCAKVRGDGPAAVRMNVRTAVSRGGTPSAWALAEAGGCTWNASSFSMPAGANQDSGAARSSNSGETSAEVRIPLKSPPHPAQRRARSRLAVWHSPQYFVMAAAEKMKITKPTRTGRCPPTG